MDSPLAWGKPDAEVMFVWEAPHKAQMDGDMFAGPDQKMLRSLLKNLPHTYQHVCIFPTPLSKPPTAAQIGEAIIDFQDRMAGRSPKIVVPLGTLALWAVMGDAHDSITDWRGYVIDPADATHLSVKRPTQVPYKTSKKGKYVKGDLRTVNVDVEVAPGISHLNGVQHVLPTLTPAAVNKSGLELMPTLGRDLHKISELLDGHGVVHSGCNYTKDLSKFSPNSVLTVDIETKMFSHNITDIGFGDPYGNVVSAPYSSLHAGHIIANASTLIAHNAAFEYEYLTHNGIDLSHTKLWDTMLAAYMLNPGAKKSLNWVISEYLLARRHKHLAGQDMSLYNALDVKRTQELQVVLENKLMEEGALKFFTEGMMPAIPTLVGMSMRGIRVDAQWESGWRLDLQREIEEAGPAIRYMARRPAACIAKFGIPNGSEEALVRLKIKNPALAGEVDEILRVRALMKNLSTYTNNFLALDRVHPSYLPGARDTDDGNRGIAYSGRPTASKPNIQNQPHEARRRFIAEDGQSLISLDWSQIEPRITANASGDDVLAADIEAGLYDAVSNTLQCDRKVAKMVVLMSAYLGSPMTLSAKLGLEGIILSTAECKKLQTRMFDRYKQWAKWRENIVSRAATHQRLQNSFGKFAYFYRPHPAKAVNFIPQSTAACILWYCLPQIEKAIAPYGGTLVTTVHDEVVCQAPHDKVSLVAEAARSVMEQPWSELGRLKIPTSTKTGTNWRDMQVPNTFWSLDAQPWSTP